MPFHFFYAFFFFEAGAHMHAWGDFEEPLPRYGTRRSLAGVLFGCCF
jgi:hypothetical protein